MVGERYNVGDEVIVTDQITCLPRAKAIIKYIEQDNEIPELFWAYLIVDDDLLNDKIDLNPQIGRYWEVKATISPYLSLA